MPDDLLNKYVQRFYGGHKPLVNTGAAKKTQTHRDMIKEAMAKREAKAPAKEEPGSKSKLPMPDYGGLDVILNQIRELEGDTPDDAA